MRRDDAVRRSAKGRPKAKKRRSRRSKKKKTKKKKKKRDDPQRKTNSFVRPTRRRPVPFCDVYHFFSATAVGEKSRPDPIDRVTSLEPFLLLLPPRPPSCLSLSLSLCLSFSLSLWRLFSVFSVRACRLKKTNSVPQPGLLPSGYFFSRSLASGLVFRFGKTREITPPPPPEPYLGDPVCFRLTTLIGCCSYPLSSLSRSSIMKWISHLFLQPKLDDFLFVFRQIDDRRWRRNLIQWS